MTVVTGRGDFFSAGADVKAAREGFGTVGEEARTAALRRLSESNLDLTRAIYRHTKILVAALNGPAIGECTAMILETLFRVITNAELTSTLASRRPQRRSPGLL